MGSNPTLAITLGHDPELRGSSKSVSSSKLDRDAFFDAAVGVRLGAGEVLLEFLLAQLPVQLVCCLASFGTLDRPRPSICEGPQDIIISVTGNGFRLI